MRETRTYADRQKVQVLAAIKRDNLSVGQASRTYNIPKGTIQSWKSRGIESSEVQTPKPSPTTGVQPGPRPAIERQPGVGYPPSIMRAAREELTRGVTMSALSKAWGISRGTLRDWSAKLPSELIDPIPSITEAPSPFTSDEEMPEFEMSPGSGFKQVKSPKVDRAEESQTTPKEITSTVRCERQTGGDGNVYDENRKLRELVVSLSLQVQELQTRN